MGYLKDSNTYHPEKNVSSTWAIQRESVDFILSKEYTLEEIQRVKGKYVWVEVPGVYKERAVALLEQLIENPTELSMVSLVSNWPLKLTFTEEVEAGGRKAMDLPYLTPRKIFRVSEEMRERVVSALDEAERRG